MTNCVTYSTLGKNGRLCNSIFQALGTMAYALDNNKDFIFPQWQYSKYFIQKLPEGTPNIDIKVPVEFHFAPIPDYPNKNVDLINGHMQSYKYFAHQWNALQSYFNINEKYYDNIFIKYGDCLAAQNCGIHVRRTDYTTPDNLEYHGILPVSYYEEGAKKLFGTPKPADVLFIICSDDIAWCKENLSFPNQIFIEHEEDVIDLFILMYCRNIIIANSSFSLFPATINSIENSNYKVVAPKKWFGQKCTQKTSDIYMPNWITI